MKKEGQQCNSTSNEKTGIRAKAALIPVFSALSSNKNRQKRKYSAGF
jgi:hypothetical protein